MKVYAVVKTVQYEGDELIGVFASAEQAEQFIRAHKDFGKWQGSSFGYVECELGQEIYFDRCVEWIG
jgi:hypothetical protein